ncbi:hypothetical protein LNL84_16595 [Vibrio sp. ZSDZ34]|uniref:Uncharacterized protein n=1 Tax=Vibrio gelatinilyticus TaxID=2893468 RepID=A0A9X1WHV6_9VIBR|nr:hypothetical protein [Vibrio gelatinilyticus]MCJ2378435.1 hypothetical protein [Vibrio gelatinilyticus]
MNTLNQRGAVVLLVTSVLMMVSLAVVVGAYKASLYQIKRAQNESSVWAQRARAEGVLDCAFAYVQTYSTSPAQLLSEGSDFSELCQLSEFDSQLIVENGEEFTLTATSGYQKVQRVIQQLGSEPQGAIQTVGPLKLIGTTVISPNVSTEPINSSEHEFACTSVTYADSFTFQYDATQGFSGRDHGLEVVAPVFDGAFPGLSRQCADDYKTVIGKQEDKAFTLSLNKSHDRGPFKKDFIANARLNPFRDLFGGNASETSLANISSDATRFKRITNFEANQCSQLIEDHFVLGEERGLWLEGHCYIDRAVAANANATQLLVVNNGALALNGSLVFNGVVYHRVDMENNTVRDSLDEFWTSASVQVHFKDFIEENSVSIQITSSFPKGGLIFDAKGGLTTLVGDLDIDYVSNGNTTVGSLSYHWKKGSWRDF